MSIEYTVAVFTRYSMNMTEEVIDLFLIIFIKRLANNLL